MFMFICLLTLLIISIIDNFAIIVSSVSLIAILMRCGVVLIKDYNNSSVYGTECRAAIAQFIVGIRSSVFIDFAMKQKTSDLFLQFSHVIRLFLSQRTFHSSNLQYIAQFHNTVSSFLYQTFFVNK